MAKVPDETLMAYADGVLNASECARVEAALAQDPEAHETLRAFERTGLPLANVFDAVLREPIPEHLVRLIEQAAPTGLRHALARRPARDRDPVSKAWWLSILPLGSPLMMAGAFSATLAAGVAAGWLFSEAHLFRSRAAADLMAFNDGDLVAAGALQQALEKAPSGTTAGSRSGSAATSVTPVLTFLDRDRRYCRQYELSASGAKPLAGVACRIAAGEWRIAIHAEAKAAKAAPKGRHLTASGPDEAIETVINRMIDGDALGADDERAALESAWKNDAH